MLYSTYVAYEHAFLQLLQLFLMYSCYKSLYYYSCIVLTVLATVQFMFFASSSTLRALIPDTIVFVIVVYYCLVIYYAYQSNRQFRAHFDLQFGEHFHSLEEFFKAFNESKAFEQQLKQKQYVH